MTTLEKFKEYRRLKKEFVEEIGAKYFYEDIEDHTDEYFYTDGYRISFDKEKFHPHDDTEGDDREAMYSEEVRHGGIYKKDGLVLISVRASTGDNVGMLFDASKRIN